MPTSESPVGTGEDVSGNGGFMNNDRDLPQLRVCGMTLLDARRQDAVARLLDGARRRVAFINADCVNIAAHDERYARDIESMDLLLPDGSGLALAARMLGKRFSDNLNGTDLFPVLCAEANRQGKSIYFLGGAPGIAERAAEAAILAHPGLRVAGTADGYFEDEAAMIARINGTGADIVLVAMGAPKQEAFIARNAAALKADLCMGVGGLFDFVAGAKPRAPSPIRRMGMEWAWRLMIEPKRLARRYLIGNPVFLARAARMAWRERARTLLYAVLKRMMDFVLASIALLVLSPFFLMAALAIIMESRGGAFFSQMRVGKNGKLFRMIKFRTMYPDAEARLASLRQSSDRDAICFKMTDDPRVTRIGGFLRKTSLDEFPQLWNVVRGEMSLVGPRPALPSEVALYTREERERLAGAPGITCLWQISGRADLKFDKQVDLDIAYLRSSSIWLDIAIIVLTPLAMISRRGAY